MPITLAGSAVLQAALAASAPIASSGMCAVAIRNGSICKSLAGAIRNRQQLRGKATPAVPLEDLPETHDPLEGYRTLKRGVMYATPKENDETITVTVNGKPIRVRAHVSRPNGDQGAATVLEACKMAGDFVPTLCHHPSIKHTEHSATCRLCMVDVTEVKGAGARLRPACVTPLRDGMEIVTQSPEIEKSVKMDLELLRARHPNACMNCDVNGRCEFQNLMYKYDIKQDPWGKMPRTDEAIDSSSPSLTRDMDKCIMCQRCVNVCDISQNMNILGAIGRGGHANIKTMSGAPLDATDCINCGQCSVVCPVGAITESDHAHKVMEHLRKKDKIMVVQNAPATRITVAEEFFGEPGYIKPLQLVAAMRLLGFDYVFDTNYSADLTTMEEAHEFIRRVKAGGPFPMFTSCCPAWINMVEKQYPEYTRNLSSCKSPMGMLGSVIKNIWAQRIGVSPEDICSVAIMPCVGKKDEAQRPQLTHPEGKSTLDVEPAAGADHHGFYPEARPAFDEKANPDVDYVLTTRELAHILRTEKIPVYALEESQYDNPLGVSTGSAQIFGVTGGVMESALRTAYEAVTGKTLQKVDFDQFPNGDSMDVRVAMAHGGRNIKTLLDKIKSGEAQYDFVELMACYGGCIGGGGNPKTEFADILQRRAKAVYDIDRKAELRKAQENPDIKRLYEEVLGEPGSHKAERLLHTFYTDRSANSRANK